jgi:hypothetical protein
MSFRYYLFSGWANIGFGLFLVRAAGFFTNFAFAHDIDKADADENESTTMSDKS